MSDSDFTFKLPANPWDLHTFGTNICNIGSFSSSNKWPSESFFIIYLPGFSLSTLRTCEKIWRCFRSYLSTNVDGAKGFTNSSTMVKKLFLVVTFKFISLRLQKIISMCRTWGKCLRSMCPLTCLTFLALLMTSCTALTLGQDLPRRVLLMPPCQSCPLLE